MERALILIIDPSEETRAMYGDYFRYHGYEVVEAADGADGVRAARELKPDLVVTELSIAPDRIRELRTIRTGPRGRRPATIACSTSLDPSWPFAPAGVEVDMALAKPISPRALLLHAQYLLGHLTSKVPALSA
jgi:CheY-like chemotaxis protein